MTDSKKIGLDGEELAANYLEKKGYSILFRNWSFLHKEIDIIAEFNNELIIIEVKTRTAGYLISPLEAVNLRKQRFIIQAANLFIQKHNVNLEVRFDIVTVIFTKYNFEIEHIENAFYPKVR